MDVLLDLEHQVLLFKHNTEVNIQGGVVLCQGGIVSILDKAPGVFGVRGSVDIFGHKGWVKVFQSVEFSGGIHHGAIVALLVKQQERWHTHLFGYPVVIGPKRGSDVYDTGTVFRGDVITGNYLESPFARIHPWYQLFVPQAKQVTAFVFSDDDIGYHLVTGLIGVQRYTGSLGVEMLGYQVFSQYARHGQT
ncbi:MAG: hypothetical protein BWY72_00900 [Bacteroidetes bacterium ADurb.Bin416]|nr:MAG: hypothetical protein BWY72_00900 [Bacteroidetes bacterium ADurb.Bin416]